MTITQSDKWTFSAPKRQGFSYKGRNAYGAVFRKHVQGMHFEEHVVFYAVRPLGAMKTIASSDAPALFAGKHFDEAGNPIDKESA